MVRPPWSTPASSYPCSLTNDTRRGRRMSGPTPPSAALASSSSADRRTLTSSGCRGTIGLEEMVAYEVHGTCSGKQPDSVRCAVHRRHVATGKVIHFSSWMLSSLVVHKKEQHQRSVSPAHVIPTPDRKERTVFTSLSAESRAEPAG